MDLLEHHPRIAFRRHVRRESRLGDPQRYRILPRSNEPESLEAMTKPVKLLPQSVVRVLWGSWLNTGAATASVVSAVRRAMIRPLSSRT